MYSIRKATATALLALGTQTAMAQISINPGNRNVRAAEGDTTFTVFSSIPATGLTVTVDNTWTEATSDAAWSARRGHTSVVFGGKMWVIGGNAGSNKNDVWSSTDGITWTQVITTGTIWSARQGHTSVVFDNKMWVIGGWEDSITLLNDVWNSTDGITWTQVTTTGTIWSARKDHTSVVFGGKMWVIGGNEGLNAHQTDVWHSTDGATWTEAIADAGWRERSFHTSVVFANKMWVIGGLAGPHLGDVWHSTDGISWMQATADAAWSARYAHTSVVFDGKMWVIGGNSGGHEVWSSTDGINWTQATDDAAWSARHGHTSVVFDNKIWMFGGYDGSRLNAVYFYEEWLTASLSGSSPGYTLTADYDANEVADRRTGTVTVSGGGLTRTATVTQAGAAPELALSPATQSVTADAGSTDFTVTTNIPLGDLTITDDAAWLTTERSGTALTADYEVNSIAVPRTGTVTVSGGGLTRTATVTQAGAAPALALSADQNVTAAAGSTDFTVTTNIPLGDLTITDDAAWLTIGLIGPTLTADYGANNTGASRTGTVTVSGGGLTRTATVTQEAFMLSLSPAHRDVAAAAGNTTFTVTTNIPSGGLTTDDAGWLIGSISGTTLTADYGANGIAAPRTGTVTVEGGGLTETVTVTQAGAVPELDLSLTNRDVTAETGSTSFTVNTNIPSGGLTTTDDADWLRVSISGTTLTADYEANEVAAPRTGTVTIEGGEPTQTVTVTITQAGAAPALALSANRDVTAETGSTTFTVTTNIPSGDLTTTDDAAWLTVRLSGTTLTADYEENNTGAPRTGTVTVSGGGLTETATVTQAAFMLSLSPANRDVRATAGDTTFTVTTNIPSGGLTTTDDAAWLTVRLSGTTLTADYEENNTGAPRTGTVTVSGGGLTRTATVTQEAFMLSLSDSQDVIATAGSTDFTVTTNIPLGDLTITGDPEWLTVSLSVTTLTADYGANGSTVLRTGTVTVSGGGLTRTATVTQAGAAPELGLSHATQNVTSEAGTANFAVTTNIPSGDLAISVDEDWLTTELSGTTLTATYKANEVAAPRTGTVTVSGGGLTVMVTVTQEGAVPELSLSPANRDVTVAEGIASFMVTTNVPSGDLTITDDADWLTVSLSGTSSPYTLTADYGANNTGVLRTGTVTVSGGGLTETVTVTQAGAVPELFLEPAKRDVTELAGSTTFMVTTDISLDGLTVNTAAAVADGAEWTRSADAPWFRQEFASVAFEGKIWVIGGTRGRSGSIISNDVWHSTDGETWTEVATTGTIWSGRSNHASVVFDNKMWVIGGDDGPNELNDVWHSTDGETWMMATANAPWSKRWMHTSVVFDNKMWVIGGSDGSDNNSNLNDVWHSIDGINWTPATADAAWSARSAHTSVVFDDKMWVIGGTDGSNKNDVWSSTDGATWTQVATTGTIWPARESHTSVVFDNKIWVIGGSYAIDSRLNDVWHSTDGATWTKATDDASWTKRAWHASVVHDSKMWVIGGNVKGDVLTDDVWHSEEWLTASLSGTVSPYTLTATYEADNGASRIATVTVSGSGTTATATVSQDAASAPTFVDATFYDTDGNGDVDQVAVQMSERIDLPSVETTDFKLGIGMVTGVADAPGGTVDATITDAYFTLMVTLPGTATTTLAYDPDMGASKLLADLAGTVAVMDLDILQVDMASPVITDLEIRDTAGDGFIDQILVTWSENIDTDTDAAPIIADVGTFTLPDGGSASFHDHDISDPGGIVNTVLISNITGQLMPNTAVGETAILVPAEKWKDGSNNRNAAMADNLAGVTDVAGPAVTVEQGSGQTDLTAMAQVVFDVVFSEPVTSFEASEVDLAASTVSGTLAVTVSGSGTDYTLEVTGMTGDGVVEASIPADVAMDATGNGNAASTSADNTVAYDGSAPTVTIEQGSTQEDPTNVASVVFDVTFSEPVAGFAASDVDLAASTVGGTLTGTVSGSGTDYTVTVTGMMGTGEVTASILVNAATDAAGNSSEASTSADNTVAYDGSAPTVTVEQGSTQEDPTNVASVVFDVAFSELVTGFEASDVDLTASTVGGTLIGMVTGSGTDYTLTVTGMTGDGMVEASVSAGGATDAAGNTNEASTSTDNTVEYDMTAPTVTIDQASGQADPTHVDPVVFDVTFSKPVMGFVSSDVDLAASTVGGTLLGTVTEVSPTDGTTYTLEVTGMIGNGVVTASIPAGAARDAAGNEALASTRATVGYTDAAPPTVTINQGSGQDDPTNVATVLFDVVFSEPVTGFRASAVDYTGSEEPRALLGTVAEVEAAPTADGTTYTLEVTGMTRDGEVVASIAAGAARDAVGNFSEASTSADNTVTYIQTAAIQNQLDPSVTWAGITAGRSTNFQITQDNLASNVEVVSFRVIITDGEEMMVHDTTIQDNLIQPYSDFMHVFNTAGEYTIEITILTANGETFDSTPSRKIQILETKPSNGYEESFEEDKKNDGDTLNGWYIEHLSLDGKSNNDLISWRHTNTIPGVGHHSGDYAIVTNALQDGEPGTYQPGEISFVYSPSFDFSGFTKPAVSFSRLVMFQSPRDGAIFQASTDDGRTWENVGAYSRFGFSGWHNSESIISAPGIVAPGPLADGVAFDDAGIGWTEDGSEGRNDDRWVEARADLSGYGGINSVRFRFALAADNREKEEDNVGFGFDNVSIFEQRRTVLVEQFSSSLDPNSITLDAMLNTDYSEDDFVVRMNYFTDLANTNGNRDPLNQRNADDPGGRIERYGVGGVPSLALAGNMIDGSKGPFGALIPSDLDEAYARLAHEKLGNPLFTINIDALIDPIDDTSLNVSADFISNTDQLDDPGTELGLHIAILEPEVVIDGETVTNVLRKMLPDAAGQYARGAVANGARLSILPIEWLITHVDDADTLVVVAFIQDINTHQVYQAAVKGVSGGQEAEVLGVEGPAHVTVYPNPGSAQVTVDFGDMAREQKEWMLFDPTGQTVRSGAVARGEATLVIDTQGLSSGMYIFQVRGEGQKSYISHRVVILH